MNSSDWYSGAHAMSLQRAQGNKCTRRQETRELKYNKLAEHWKPSEFAIGTTVPTRCPCNAHEGTTEHANTKVPQDNFNLARDESDARFLGHHL